MDHVHSSGGGVRTNALQPFYASLSDNEVTYIKTSTAAGTKTGVQSFVHNHCPGLKIDGAGHAMCVRKQCEPVLDLRQHLVCAGVVRNKATPGTFCMEQMEKALQEYVHTNTTSKKQIKAEVRGLGVNLCTGEMYGSPTRLCAALRHGAERTSKKHAKQYPLVKSCLVEA